MSYTVTTVRLTPDNVDTVFRPGDAFTDDPDFGIVVSATSRANGRGAWITTDRDADWFGLPQTVRLTRVVI